ncbi:Hypothetical predicted protein [Lecanosticta acicola]|uniref:2EXR domain-containing protein n=1 Tax=Lecanosticta acicola TaxID=111012 RepID=A0AAI9E8J3_9PEZI|nr:Hypothetical predicted protein [Lecanosticta acicola]
MDSEDDDDQSSLLTPYYFFEDPDDEVAAADTKRLADLEAIRAKDAEVNARERSSLTVEKVWVVPRIFTLPVEVRKRIFHFALFPKGVTPSPHFTRESKYRVKVPALLRTCRDMRAEALPVYYGSFRCSAFHYKNIIGWLKMIDPEAKKVLKSIIVRAEAVLHDRRGIQDRDVVLVAFKKAGVDTRKVHIKVIY